MPALPPKPGKPESAKKPEEMLSMQNLNDDEEEEDAPVKSATQFFAIPTPKKGLKKPDAQPAFGAPKAESTGGRSFPGAGNSALIQGPTNAPGQLGASPMAIMGPVAGNPNAGQAPGGQGAGFSVVGPNAVGEAPDAENRGSSWKIFAIILGLLFMVGSAVLVAVVIVVVGMNMAPGDAGAKETEDDRDKAVTKDDGPVGEDVPTEREMEHKAAPAPRKPSKPAPSGDKPAAAPAAPKKAADAMKIAGVDPDFNKAQVQCEGYNKTVSFTDGAATFPDVPTSGACKITFKGIAIVGTDKVNGGRSYNCSVSPAAAKCK